MFVVVVEILEQEERRDNCELKKNLIFHTRHVSTFWRCYVAYITVGGPQP